MPVKHPVGAEQRTREEEELVGVGKKTGMD